MESRHKPTAGKHEDGYTQINTGDYCRVMNYDIDLPNNTWGNDVRESVKRGDVDGSSFGFICLEDKWSKVQHEGEDNVQKKCGKSGSCWK